MGKFPLGIPDDFLNGHDPKPSISSRAPELTADFVRNGDGSVTFFTKKIIYLSEETIPAKYAENWSDDEALDKLCDWASL